MSKTQSENYLEKIRSDFFGVQFVGSKKVNFELKNPKIQRSFLRFRLENLIEQLGLGLWNLFRKVLLWEASRPAGGG